MTVIGLGPMGQAMTHAFLDEGHHVTVFNRTASRADALVAHGATLATSVEDALAASDLVILSLTDYDAMYAVLAPAAHAPTGRVLVNLSSDAPEKTRAGARWVTGLGAVHLTGGVSASPTGIGQPGSSTFYSGPRQVFEAHRPTLEVLTGTDYRGEDPGQAALLHQISAGMFWTSVLGYWQAIALAQANGLTAADILPQAAENMTGMADFLSFYAARIDAGEHGGEVERPAMGMAGVEHVLHTNANADAGVDTALPAAAVALFRRGMEAGHGGRTRGGQRLQPGGTDEDGSGTAASAWHPRATGVRPESKKAIFIPIGTSLAIRTELG